MAAMFSKGIVLVQHKEPAFSRSLIRFVNPQTDAQKIDYSPVSELSEMSSEDIIKVAREAGIVDERDGKPLYRKLLRAAKNKAQVVIVDAVDDEPYVSSQINPLLQLKEEAMGGLGLCQKVCGAEEAYITVYKMLTDLETRIPKWIDKVRVIRLRGGYPAEPRYVKIGSIEGRRKLLVGVCSLIHLYRAVYQAKRQTSVFLTVAGNCIANPANYEISIGTRVEQVLERVGLSGNPTRIVSGGPMTGITVIDCEKTTIMPTTRALLAFREDHKDGNYRCIGCGRCEQVCPSGLNPMYIYKYMEHHYYPGLKYFDPSLCIGCGTCSYICPSKLDVSFMVEKAKHYTAARFAAEEEEADDLEG